MICNYWKELDDDSGLFEYCRAEEKKCICGGDTEQCCFLWNLVRDDESEGVENLFNRDDEPKGGVA